MFACSKACSLGAQTDDKEQLMCLPQTACHQLFLCSVVDNNAPALRAKSRLVEADNPCLLLVLTEQVGIK